MPQRHVESLIGRMLTDEQLRAHFLADPRGTLGSLVAAGVELTSLEIDALVATDPELFRLGAAALDPRIVKASLENHCREDER